VEQGVDRDLTLGDRLKIRTMVYVASEPIPRFWPMRTFIHHNPLFGLEHLPFDQAVQQGAHLFHGRGYLPRRSYQRYRSEGKVDDRALRRYLHAFLERHDPRLPGIDLQAWLWAVLVSSDREAICPASDWLDGPSLHAALIGKDLGSEKWPGEARLASVLQRRIQPGRAVYSQIDLLFGTQIATTLDDLLVKSCLDFFDEGQSVWQAPNREDGFYRAWKEVARRDVRLLLHGRDLPEILASDEEPEAVVAHTLGRLRIPEDSWQDYILHELTHLHGWAGFIRFRSQAQRYYWAERYPADLTDFLAVRMVIGLTLVQEAVRRLRCPGDCDAIQTFVGESPYEAYLRSELYGGTILPGWAQRADSAIGRGRPRAQRELAASYIDAKRRHEARHQAEILQDLADRVGPGAEAALRALSAEDLERLLDVLRRWEDQEGYTWLRAMEAHYIDDLLDKVRIPVALDADRRPFAQAFFCIDVRSEPLRRNLEALGDYKTFGTAGFFGVPIGFLEYGNGSEQPLCPAIMSPKSLIVEIPADLDLDEEPLYGALSHVFHDLKASILAPFVAVEAAGLLFSLGLIGKTVWPVQYHRAYKRLHANKPATRLLIDKLTPEQADSILRAVQRAMIVQAVQKELGLSRDRITDDDVRELREIALGNAPRSPALAARLGLVPDTEADFIETLRTVYRVDPREAGRQMERLGRLGFTLEEQAQYVARTLLSCGLKRNFSRFVLMIGHESLTRNNPYESALDCGAAGGAHGLPNARVICAMANKADVRSRLRELGVSVPDDTWFVPGAHNTTTDEVTLHDLDLLPARHLLYLERLRDGLAAATKRTAAERISTLGFSEKLRTDPDGAAAIAMRQANDWSQVRPEWGLCRNLYGIIGRRELTEGVDLEGRAFLLSYDYRLDPDGRFLENLLSAPVVVGEWINLEHYFSTVDVHRFGSGSKAYHNVAGRFGVMTGNQSDLRTGLPLQTLYRDGQPYHEPLRLISLVEAPASFVLDVVGRLPKVKSLITGGWLRVIVLDPEDDHKALVYEEGEFVAHPRSGLGLQTTILEDAP
jgi:uncharacterized protein YbcC (UPF0753/DUF2309 family)